MAKKQKQNNRRGPRVISFSGIFYLLIILGLVYMWTKSSTADPVKKEWLDVKAELLRSGDVEKLVYIRNERRGEIHLKQNSIEKYKNIFAGVPPKSGPHFYFLVSENFDAEQQFEQLENEINWLFERGYV